MAATRPAVLVYQEFATLTTGVATPELNCMIAGPAYWIKDFLDDRAATKVASVYGEKNSDATGSSAAPVDDLVVAEPPSNSAGAVLDAASVKIYFGAPRVELANDNDGAVTTGAPTLSSAIDFADLGVVAGDFCIVTVGGSSQVLKVRSVATTTLTFTDQVTLTTSAAALFRVERELADSLVDSSMVAVAGNEVTVSAGATLTVGSSDLPVTYAEVFMQYRSLRQDLADVLLLSSVAEVTTLLGKVDARNPLAVGAFVALSNSSAAIQAFGVTSDDSAGYFAMQSSISNRKDIYAIVPLIQDLSVIATLKANCEDLASPEYAVDNGVAQKFRMVVGAPTALPTTKIVVDLSATGKTESNAVLPGVVSTLVFGSGNLITAGVLPGDKLTISNDTAAPSVRDGTYTVAHVNSATELEVNEPITAGADIGDADVSIFVGQSATPRTGYNDVNFVGLISQANDALVLDLLDASATFIDDGVLPGDFIQMPRNPSLGTDSAFAASDKFLIETVVSNQRLRIKNNGNDTALVANELPHGVTRNAPTQLVASTAALNFRVVRTLSKSGQVDELISVASSLKSRRAVICWPDKITVNDLVDGSLPRASASVPASAAPQPGFYLACALGGMMASLPSHQGLTNMGISGVSKLFNASTYFDDKQMTQISNSGWLVFQQDTPSSLPYIIHQLTTDPSTLEFGELSLVKNFDFVSLFFSDILDDFIGIWNINDETMGFMAAAVQSGIENLKLRRRIRIGAPIIAARLTSIAQSTASADRIELYVEVDFPKPLNTVGLHIVSV